MKNPIDLLKSALTSESSVLVKHAYIEHRFFHEILFDAANPLLLDSSEFVGLFQLVYRPADAGFMANEGGANGIPANQTDDVRCHLLVGQLRNGGVELLGGEALPV